MEVQTTPTHAWNGMEESLDLERTLTFEGLQSPATTTTPTQNRPVPSCSRLVSDSQTQPFREPKRLIFSP
jgi:hypothetical protein